MGFEPMTMTLTAFTSLTLYQLSYPGGEQCYWCIFGNSHPPSRGFLNEPNCRDALLERSLGNTTAEFLGPHVSADHSNILLLLLWLEVEHGYLFGRLACTEGEALHPTNPDDACCACRNLNSDVVQKEQPRGDKKLVMNFGSIRDGTRTHAHETDRVLQASHSTN